MRILRSTQWLDFGHVLGKGSLIKRNVNPDSFLSSAAKKGQLTISNNLEIRSGAAKHEKEVISADVLEVNET